MLNLITNSVIISELIRNFLNNLFFLTAFMLSILSILLIYSIMVSEIQEKNRQFGIMRALGLN